MFYLPEEWGTNIGNIQSFVFPKRVLHDRTQKFWEPTEFLGIILISFHLISRHREQLQCTVLNGVVISRWCIGKDEEGDCRDIIQNNIPDFSAGNEENLKKRERETVNVVCIPSRILNNHIQSMF